MFNYPKLYPFIFYPISTSYQYIQGVAVISCSNYYSVIHIINICFIPTTHAYLVWKGIHLDLLS